MKKYLIIISLILSSAIPDYAGQLHIRRYGLARIIRNSAYVISAEAVEPIFKKNLLRAKVVKVWSLPGKENKNIKKGNIIKFKIYGGVVWDNPRKSPIDNRLWNYTSLGNIKKGQKIILVPYLGFGGEYEIMKIEENTSRKLRAFFFDKGMDVYKEKTEDKDLANDLLDFDLYGPAYDALKKRKKLGVSVIRMLNKAYDRNNILDKHYSELKPQGRKKFLQLLQRSMKKSSRVLHYTLRVLADKKIEVEYAGELAGIFNLLDPSVKKDAELVYYIKSDLINRMRDAKSTEDVSSHFMSLIAAYEKHRPRYSSSDKELFTFINLLNRNSRVVFLDKLASIMYSSNEATGFGNSGYDGFILHTIEKTVSKYPSTEHLKTISKIDPLVSEIYSRQKGIMGSILRMSVNIIKKDSRAAGSVFLTTEPYLRHGIKADREILNEYRKLTKKVRSNAPSREMLRANTTSELKLVPGEFMMTMTGFRVKFTPPEKGEDDYTVSINSNINRGRGLGMKINSRWYFEGMERGHLFIIDGSGKGKPEINITIYPKSDKKRKMLSEPDILKIAEKASGKSGCTEYGDHNYKRWDGIFKYESATPKGKKCRFTLGAYTGRIIQLK